MDLNRTPANFILIISAISGFLWVLIGAINGHSPLSSPYVNYMEKAQRYHIVHTIVCLYLSLALVNKRRLLAVVAFYIGIVCFSGALYLMAIYHWPLNFVVPIGGVSFLVGWAMLIYDASKTI